MITQTCFTEGKANLNQKGERESQVTLKGGQVHYIVLDLRLKKTFEHHIYAAAAVMANTNNDSYYKERHPERTK